MKRRLASERGSAVVTALLVTMLFMTLGIAALGFVDTQQRESGRERVRDSSFVLAEGVSTRRSTCCRGSGRRALRAYGTAGIVENSFREITASG